MANYSNKNSLVYPSGTTAAFNNYIITKKE